MDNCAINCRPGWSNTSNAKPLPVGGCSKDADALYGRAASCKAKGYKLFVLQDAAAGVADTWLLGPMSWSEQKAADVLLERLSGSALVIGDGEYDVSRLHDLAASHDSALLTPPPPDAKSTGHHYQSPHRKNGLALARSSVGAVLLMLRIGIEQSFGNLTSFGGGLGPLPAWVRRPHRVVVWVAAKLLINLDRQIQLRQRYEQLPMPHNVATHRRPATGPSPCAAAPPGSPRKSGPPHAGKFGRVKAIENAQISGSAALGKFISDSFPIRRLLTTCEHRRESDLLIGVALHGRDPKTAKSRLENLSLGFAGCAGDKRRESVNSKIAFFARLKYGFTGVIIRNVLTSPRIELF